MGIFQLWWGEKIWQLVTDLPFQRRARRAAQPAGQKRGIREIHLRTIADVLKSLKPSDDEDSVFQREAAEAHIRELLAASPAPSGWREALQWPYGWRWTRLRGYLTQWLTPHQYDIAKGCLEAAMNPGSELESLAPAAPAPPAVDPPEREIIICENCYLSGYVGTLCPRCGHMIGTQSSGKTEGPSRNARDSASSARMLGESLINSAKTDPPAAPAEGIHSREFMRGVEAIQREARERVRLTVEQIQQAEKGANLSDYLQGSANWYEVYLVHLNHALRTPEPRTQKTIVPCQWMSYARGGMGWCACGNFGSEKEMVPYAAWEKHDQPLRTTEPRTQKEGS